MVDMRPVRHRAGTSASTTPWAVVAAALLLLAAACNGGGGTSSSDADTGLSDVGVDATPDGSGDTDGRDTGDRDGGGDDTGLDDTGSDTGAMEDGSDADGGGDGDGGDGCQLDVVNTDIDRDRDKLHDECDNFKYLNHGGDNVDEATTITEDESRRPNDNVIQAERNYDLDLPVQIDGEVGPIENDGDLDHYSFEIDEPTVILLRLEARTDKLWPGALVFGRENRNRNVRPQLVGADEGENAIREMFLPVPGRYDLAISDFRNLVSDDQALAGGGSGDYPARAHVSAVPMPAIDEIGAPGSDSHQHDGRIHVHSLDASDLTGVKVTAAGVARAMDSGLTPTLALYDPESERTLGFTVGPQVNQDTLTVSLTTRLEKQWDELYVIDDYISRFGETSTKVDVVADDAATELETAGQPRDDRSDRLTWLQPGTSIDATIGPPRTAGPTSLTPDEDYFLLSTDRGQTIRVTVSPKSGSPVQPEIAMGWYRAQQGGGGFFNSFGGHQAPAADQPGGDRSLTFLFNDASDGEVAFRIRHAPNNSADSPVGGSDYAYTVKTEALEPSPDEVSPLPGSVGTQFEPGGIGLVSFDSPEGKVVRVGPAQSNQSDLDLDGRLTRTDDWHEIGASSGRIEFYAPAAKTYWYDVRDDDGRGTGGDALDIEVETSSVDEIASLPGTVDADLAGADEVDYYTFDATAGERYDVRLQTEAFQDRIAVFTASDYRRVARDGGGAVFRAPRDGTYVVRVQSTNSQAGSYTLGVQTIQASEIASIPSTETGTLDDAPFPAWYKFESAADAAYQLTLAHGGGTEFDGRVAAYDGSDMTELQDGGLGTVPLRPGFEDDVYVAVYEENQGGGSDYDFELTVGELDVQPINPGQTKNGTLGDGRERKLYTFSSSKGAVDIDVSSDGAWTPKVQLVEQGDLDPVTHAEPHNGMVHHAETESGEYAVLLRAHDTTRSGPLDFSITVDALALGGNTNDTEPNNSINDAQTLMTLPAGISGTLGSGDPQDHFGLSLQSGQRIWLMAIPKDRGLRYFLRPELALIDPDGDVFEDNQFGGYGLFPILENVRVEASGDWTIQLKRGQNQRDTEYTLYVFTGDAFSATDQEPNDDRMNAQDLGTIDAPARIQATVDAGDPTDVYAFKLKRDLDRLRVFLDDATPGHDLRLTDNAGHAIAAAGPSPGGATTPELTPQNLDAGIYYLEVAQGDGGGDLDVLMWLEP